MHRYDTRKFSDVAVMVTFADAQADSGAQSTGQAGGQKPRRQPSCSTWWMRRPTGRAGAGQPDPDRRRQGAGMAPFATPAGQQSRFEGATSTAGDGLIFYDGGEGYCAYLG